MATKALIDPQQLKDLKSELKAYDVNWIDRLEKQMKERYPGSDFHKQKLYTIFLGKKKGALHVAMVFTEATLLLQQIKEEFARAFPPTTILAFNKTQTTQQHGEEVRG